MTTNPDLQDAAVLERQEQTIQPPPLYQVLLFDDDYTPMDFVVMILQEYFGKDKEMATRIMLRVHHEGRGVCGVYTRDVASTRVAQVTSRARQAGHPLVCTMEEA